FRDEAADLFTECEREIYQHSDPERLDFTQLGRAISQTLILVSPMNLGEENPSSKGLVKKTPHSILCTASIPFSNLSRREIDWLVSAFQTAHAERTDYEKSVNIAVELHVDNVEGIDHWLPPRVVHNLFL